MMWILIRNTCHSKTNVFVEQRHSSEKNSGVKERVEESRLEMIILPFLCFFFKFELLNKEMCRIIPAYSSLAPEWMPDFPKMADWQAAAERGRLAATLAPNLNMQE